MQHQGVYTCRGANFLGSTEVSYTLTVLKDDCIDCGSRGNGLCINGRCCIVPVVNETACRCDSNYEGQRCKKKKVPLLPRNKINIIEARYHQQTIAIMGVCIALLLVIFICYVVYCKFKKSRSHLRKEIIARNGHVSGRTDFDGSAERQISTANTAGILGDERNSRDIQLTNYRSTNLSEAQPPQAQALAFAQRPQTYDEVILSAQESQPLVQEPPTQSGYHSRHAEALAAAGHKNESSKPNGRRRRRKGIAIGQSGDPHQSGSDIENKRGPRRLDELKSSGQNSMSSSASSLASRDLKRPAMPLEERLSHLAMKGVQKPPAYMNGERSDEVDFSAHQGPVSSHSQISHELPPHSTAPSSSTTSSLPTSPTGRERVASSISSGSTHRVTTFDNDGRIEEEMLDRDDSALLGVTPHSPNLSPQNTSQRLPSSHDMFTDQIQNPRTPPIASPGSDISTGSHRMSPRSKFPYQNKNMPGNVYPYYEHNPEYPHSPTTSRHDSEDISSGIDLPGSSPQFFSHDSQRRNPPSSPRHYQTNPEMGMGVPYRHPVTVASARHHHLPLLTKEKPELPHMDSERIPIVGSTVSLSSSNSSNATEQNRNSHKIEV